MLCDPRSEGPFTGRGTAKLPLKMRDRVVEGINSQVSNELRKTQAQGMKKIIQAGSEKHLVMKCFFSEDGCV